MMFFVIWVDVKKSIQELVVPEIRQVLAEAQTLRVGIKRLDEKLELMPSKLKAEMDSLRKGNGNANRGPSGEDRFGPGSTGSHTKARNPSGSLGGEGFRKGVIPLTPTSVPLPKA